MKYSLRKDIESIVSGLYRMNATTAEKYAYCHNEDKSKVYSGEFRFFCEDDPTIDEFDGYMDFKTGKIVKL